MADNVPITPGNGGAIVATDDVGGVQFQIVKLDVGASGASTPVSGALPVSAAALPLPSGAATSALQGGGLPAALGQTTKALSLAVVAPGAATAARTSVAATVADTALLAADATRIGVTIYNDSTAICYVGYGATAASLTNYSVQVPAGGYLEVPREFVACAIRGYWAAANGAARVTVG